MKRLLAFLLLILATASFAGAGSGAGARAQTAPDGDWFERVFGARLRGETASASAPAPETASAPKAGYLSISSAPNVVICLGDTCFLTANHASYGSGTDLHFSWHLISNGTDYDQAADTSSYAYEPQAEDECKIYAVMTDEGVEVGRDTINLYVSHKPREIEPVPDSICYGKEATIGIAESGEDNGGRYWAWSTGGTPRFINIRPNSLFPDSVGIFHFPLRISLYPVAEYGWANACYTEDLSWVYVFGEAQYTVEGPDGMCLGEEVHLEVKDGTDVTWNGKPGETTYTFTMERDTMLVTVIATDRYGCRLPKLKKVAKIETPDGEIVAYVDEEETEDVCLGRTLRLEAVSEIAEHYLWFTRDTARIIELIPKTDFTAYCDFYVGGGKTCALRVQKPIRVENCNRVYFASGFVLEGYSPTYGPIGIEDSTRTYSFSVFDRNGTMVFSTDKFSEGWDGTYKGKLVPPGVYAYIFVERYEQMVWTRRGTVSVVR